VRPGTRASPLPASIFFTAMALHIFLRAATKRAGDERKKGAAVQRVALECRARRSVCELLIPGGGPSSDKQASAAIALKAPARNNVEETSSSTMSSDCGPSAILLIRARRRSGTIAPAPQTAITGRTGCVPCGMDALVNHGCKCLCSITCHAHPACSKLRLSTCAGKTSCFGIAIDGDRSTHRWRCSGAR